MKKKAKYFMTNGAAIGFLIIAIGWWVSDTSLSTGDNRLCLYLLLLFGSFIGVLVGFGIYENSGEQND